MGGRRPGKIVLAVAVAVGHSVGAVAAVVDAGRLRRMSLKIHGHTRMMATMM
jgi:hypothetical protein